MCRPYVESGAGERSWLRRRLVPREQLEGEGDGVGGRLMAPALLVACALAVDEVGDPADDYAVGVGEPVDGPEEACALHLDGDGARRRLVDEHRGLRLAVGD